MNIHHNTQNKFYIEGMTCQACVEKINTRLKSLSGVVSSQVSLEEKSATVTADRTITSNEVKTLLSDLPKYTVLDQKPIVADIHKSSPAQKSKWKTYKPLLTVFAFILIICLSVQFSRGVFDRMLFMNHIMAGFFIGLSFFKFLDLKAFSESFSSYDPIAQKWLSYGLIYPFIEVALGVLFITGLLLPLANALTVLVLGLTTYGVYKRLQSKTQFQCACLGTAFDLPLSYVTIAENLVMIGMAIYGLTV